jgi:WG containing repeat
MKKIISLILFIQINFVLDAQILVPYRLKDKWGYSDTLGNIKIAPKYTLANFFIDKTARAFLQKKYTYIDKKGKELYNYFDEITEQEDGYAFVTNNKKSGIVKGKKVIIPLIYDELYNANYEYRFQHKKFAAIGVINNKHYLIDYVKNITTKIKEEDNSAMAVRPEARDYENNEEYKSRYKEELQTYIKNGVIDSFEIIYNNIYLVSKQGKYGLYKATDYSNPFINKLIDCKYEQIKSYVNVTSNNKIPNNFIAKLNGKYGLVDDYDNVLLPFEYDDLINHNISFVYTIKNNKMGCFIFNTSYPAIACKYENMEYKESLSVSDKWSLLIFEVKLNGRLGYVGENRVEFFKD